MIGFNLGESQYFFDIVTISMRWQRIPAVTSSTWLNVLASIQVDLNFVEQFKALMCSSFYSFDYLNSFDSTWVNVKTVSHGNHFDEVTADMRCNLIYKATMREVLTANKVYFKYSEPLALSIYEYVLICETFELFCYILFDWIRHRWKSRLFRMVTISMRWQRRCAVASSKWLPCEKSWLPPTCVLT